VEIVQILVGPNDSKWQGTLVGLGDDGCVYVYQDKWVLFIDCEGVGK